MSKTKSSSTAPRPSLSRWQARSLHTVTCPSGQRLRIRILGLAAILEMGDLPEDLIDIVMLELTTVDGVAGALAKDLVGDEITDEQRERVLSRMKDYGRLQRYLAINAIEEVEEDGGWYPIDLELDDLDALPEDDLAMVAEIVQRLRNQDARGVTIGVEPLDRWATFREAHGCADQGCPSCEEVIRRFSSSDMGPV